MPSIFTFRLFIVQIYFTGTCEHFDTSIISISLLYCTIISFIIYTMNIVSEISLASVFKFKISYVLLHKLIHKQICITIHYFSCTISSPTHTEKNILTSYILGRFSMEDTLLALILIINKQQQWYKYTISCH